MLNGVAIPPPGRYILAVSGGVDSVVLVDILVKAKTLELVVAHYDHGMRQDSYKDEKLVKNLAMQYGLEFESGNSKPGLLKSEDDARKARYRFFEEVRSKHKAKAIITAHHQDDLIETALINLLRGTGRKGLSAISTNPGILRPLIKVPKEEIRRYAKQHQLVWVEDSTNADIDYLRNSLRNQFLVKLKPLDRVKLVDNLQKVAETNSEADIIIATLSRDLIKNNTIDRAKLANLPRKVGDEVLAEWLRGIGSGDFDKKTLNRLSLAIKTAKPGKNHSINNRLVLVLTASKASIKPTDGNS